MPFDIPTHIFDLDRATAERLMKRTVRRRRLRGLATWLSSLAFVSALWILLF